MKGLIFVPFLLFILFHFSSTAFFVEKYGEKQKGSNEDHDNDYEVERIYANCGKTMEVPTGGRIYFKTIYGFMTHKYDSELEEHYKKNHHKRSHNYQDDPTINTCVTSYHADEDKCLLKVVFEFVSYGEKNCEYQYITFSHGQNEHHYCGRDYYFPTIYRTECNHFVMSHYLAAGYDPTFYKGYVECIRKPLPRIPYPEFSRGDYVSPGCKKLNSLMRAPFHENEKCENEVDVCQVLTHSSDAYCYTTALDRKCDHAVNCVAECSEDNPPASSEGVLKCSQSEDATYGCICPKGTETRYSCSVCNSKKGYSGKTACICCKNY